MDDAVARALAIGPGSSTAERIIDIITLGRRSGIPRRIEVWFHRIDGRWYLIGMPAGTPHIAPQIPGCTT